MHNFFSEPFPRFDIGGNIILDSIRPEQDANEYFMYMNNPNVRKFISAGNLPSSIEKAKEDLSYWGSLFPIQRGFYWAIRDNEKLIGTAGFNTLSFVHLKGEISYELAYDYWSKGIMSKTINKIVDFAQNKIGLIRIQACTPKINKKSIKLLERCKFKSEGLMKKFEVLNDEHEDYILYANTK